MTVRLGADVLQYFIEMALLEANDVKDESLSKLQRT